MAVHDQRNAQLIGGKLYSNVNATDLVLKWPAWFPPTYQDRLAEAQSLREALNAGIVSQAAASIFDVQDYLPDRLRSWRQGSHDEQRDGGGCCANPGVLRIMTDVIIELDHRAITKARAAHTDAMVPAMDAAAAVGEAEKSPGCCP